MTQTGAIPEAALEVLKKVSTGMVIDALAMSGIEGGVAGIRPARGFEDAKIVGPAATILFAPPRPDTPKLSMYRAIRSSAPGSVLVVDGRGVDGHFTGDNQGECARRQGLLAMVVYGGARDVAGYRELGMPLYCTGSATRDKPRDLQITAHNVAIQVGGVLVKPGDIIVADEDGIAVIPAEALDEVMENMKTIFEVEDGAEKAIGSDAPVEEIEALMAKKKPKK